MNATANIQYHAERAAEVFGGLDYEALGVLNMTEGFKIAALFEALGHGDTARHIISEVWEGEDEGSRDPLPWVNGHGSRRDDDVNGLDTEPHEGDERFHFHPREAWEEAEDTLAYWAARECAECGAYEGPLVLQTDGRTLCKACEASA